MRVDRAGAEEQRHGDFLRRRSAGDLPDDQPFLGGEQFEWVRPIPARPLPGRDQLAGRPFGERGRADRGERLVRRLQFGTGLGTAAAPRGLAAVGSVCQLKRSPIVTIPAGHPAPTGHRRHDDSEPRSTTFTDAGHDQRMVRKMAEELRGVIEAWSAMELYGNVDGLRGLLLDDFVGIDPLGFMLDKQQWLARYTSGDFAYQALVWGEVGIREYGDAAVVTGVQLQQATYQGNPNDGRFRGSQVYVQVDGRWKLAGIQLSMMPGTPMPGPPR